METISASDVILGLLALVMALISGGMKMLWSKVVKNETQIADNREQMHSEMKDIYAKHDASSEKVRTEIKDLASSLRNDMAKHNESTTKLLLQIAQK